MYSCQVTVKRKVVRGTRRYSGQIFNNIWWSKVQQHMALKGTTTYDVKDATTYGGQRYNISILLFNRLVNFYK